MQTLNKC
jgi:hypothetical protein